MAIVRREFLAFVRTKWFVVGTLFGPLIMSIFIVLPVFFAEGGGERRVVVVDATGRGVGGAVAEALAASDAGEESRYRTEVLAAPAGASDSLAEALRRRVAADEIDGWIWLPDGIFANEAARYEGRHATSFRDLRETRLAVQRGVQEERLRGAGIDPAVLAEVLGPVEVEARGLSEESSRGTPDDLFMAAQFMALALYLVILLYGNAILRAVREEKENRIVELVLSSVAPERLMAGKVFGIGAAGLLQLSAWVVFAGLAITFADDVAPALGASVPELPAIPLQAGAFFLLYFTGGYFLYAAIYAALGAVATSGQEAQNLQYPAIAPLMISFFMVFAVLDDPTGDLAVLGTMIPFSAPLVVPVRALLVPIPWWELVLSLGLLAASCAALLWVGGKVYKVTVLATGKRPRVRQLWRWIRAA
jgi:ABC-2 type transport system permease protein